MEVAGSDNQGREFKSSAEMWKEQLGDGVDSHKKVDWYRNGVGYWQVSCLFCLLNFINFKQ